MNIKEKYILFRNRNYLVWLCISLPLKRHQSQSTCACGSCKQILFLLAGSLLGPTRMQISFPSNESHLAGLIILWKFESRGPILLYAYQVLQKRNFPIKRPGDQNEMHFLKAKASIKTYQVALIWRKIKNVHSCWS